LSISVQGKTETLVLDYARNSNGTMDACVAKMGLVNSPGRFGVLIRALQTAGRTVIGLPKIELSKVAAALLDQAVNGFDKETLINEDLIRIGQQALAD
jgi:hypothetical protein